MGNYIKVTPSNVYAITFEGDGELTTEELKACIPGLSNDCVEYDEPPEPPATIKSPLLMDGPADCLWQCLTGVAIGTTTGVGGVAALSGAIPKKLAGVREIGAPFASIPSILAHKKIVKDFAIPKWMPTNKVPTLRMGKGVVMLSTTSGLRFIGRWIPLIGWGLLAADMIAIDSCYAKCRGQKSWMQWFQEDVLWMNDEGPW